MAQDGQGSNYIMPWLPFVTCKTSATEVTQVNWIKYFCIILDCVGLKYAGKKIHEVATAQGRRN